MVTAQDTLYVNGESLNQVVTYRASNQIVHDVPNRRIYLYGNAEVQSEGFSIKAGYIRIDIDSNIVEASYRLDSTNAKVVIKQESSVGIVSTLDGVPHRTRYHDVHQIVQLGRVP